MVRSAAEFDSHGARLVAAEARLRCAQLALSLGDAKVAQADVHIALAEFRRQWRAAWTARATVENTLVAVVIRPQGVRLVELGPIEPVYREISMLLFALRRLLRDGQHARQARQSAEFSLAALRRTLVTPLGVADGDPLVVVPSDPLHSAPWSGLHTGEICVVPSATFWARSRRAAVRPDGTGVALVAGPGLPVATAEVRECIGHVPRLA